MPVRIGLPSLKALRIVGEDCWGSYAGGAASAGVLDRLCSAVKAGRSAVPPA